MWERRSSAAHTPAAGIHTIRRIRARRSLVAASADVSTTPARQPTSSRSNDPSGPKYILCWNTAQRHLQTMPGEHGDRADQPHAERPPRGTCAQRDDKRDRPEDVELLLCRERPEMTDRAGQRRSRGLRDVRDVKGAEQRALDRRAGGEELVRAAGRDQERRHDREADERERECG